MNLFYLDEDPRISAKYHCDQHALKMIVEYAQMMSAAHRVIDGSECKILSTKTGRSRKYWEHPTLEDVLYKPTHVNHPTSIWVRESTGNYMHTYLLFYYLSQNYFARTNRVHKSWEKLANAICRHPDIKKREFTPPPQCMPEEFRMDDTVEAYRNFYNKDKSRFATFKLNGTPHWYNPLFTNDRECDILISDGDIV